MTTTDLLSVPAPSADSSQNRLTTTDLTALVAAVAADPSAWRPVLQFPEQGGERWWTRLSSSPAVDIWLLSWLPGQTTDLHDHGPSGAAFVVLQGVLDEVRADSTGHQVLHTRTPGAVIVVPPGVVHDVTGSGPGPAVSIHGYSPPLTEMNYYDRSGAIVRTVHTHSPEEELVR